MGFDFIAPQAFQLERLTGEIDLDDVAKAKTQGIALIVNNRPEGEAEDQTPGAEIEQAAQAAGMRYCAIPVTHAGFSESQVSAMCEALAEETGKVLAYCRSGTRSTLLWALALASKGEDPSSLTQSALAAGYDLAPISEAMEILSARARV